jgi:hypothetical protein
MPLSLIRFFPFTQEEVPVINFGSAGVIRCRRCRTYINPYATFADAGRKWRCNLCTLLNDGNYNYPELHPNTSLCYRMAEIDHTGRLMIFHVRSPLISTSCHIIL